MFKVFGFYKFIKIKSLKKNKNLLQKFLITNNIKGTIIVAKEGLNGTISGNKKNIEKTIKKLKSLFSFKYLGKSLKLFTFGFTDPLKVPTLYSKGFLVSIM